MGRFVSVWGANGVRSTASTMGCTIGPPAARLYAVEPVGLAMIRPSARDDMTNCSPSVMAKSMMFDSAALPSTTSLRTMRSATTASLRSTRECSIRRSSMRAVPASTDSSDGYSSGSVISVRKPRLPKLTARIGGEAAERATRPATPSSVPSPPSTRISSAADGSSSREQVGGPWRSTRRAVSLSTTTPTPRAPSQSVRLATTAAASRSRVLATMPTVAGGPGGGVGDVMRSLRPPARAGAGRTPDCLPRR